MAITIQFYGPLGDALGREVTFEAADAATVGALRVALARTWPDHADALLSPRLKTLIHDTFVSDDATLDDVKAVEFLPPVSGG